MVTRRRISEEARPHSRRMAPWGRVAVIIPVRDEATLVADAIRDVRNLSADAEILVVDGESTDDSAAIARAAGALVVRSSAGRGIQMNAGACCTRAEILVFLHVDCRLPPEAFEAMREVFAAGHDAGVFAITYPSSHVVLRLLSRLSHLRTPWTEFGEAGLFIHRRLFERIGGFPEWPLFEDLEVLARVRRHASLGRARGSIQASPRRYLQRGVWRQQGLNFLLYVLYRLGVPATTLARLYVGKGRPAATPLKRP